MPSKYNKDGNNRRWVMRASADRLAYRQTSRNATAGIFWGGQKKINRRRTSRSCRNRCRYRRCASSSTSCSGRSNQWGTDSFWPSGWKASSAVPWPSASAQREIETDIKCNAQCKQQTEMSNNNKAHSSNEKSRIKKNLWSHFWRICSQAERQEKRSRLHFPGLYWGRLRRIPWTACCSCQSAGAGCFWVSRRGRASDANRNWAALLWPVRWPLSPATIYQPARHKQRVNKVDALIFHRCQPHPFTLDVRLIDAAAGGHPPGGSGSSSRSKQTHFGIVGWLFDDFGRHPERRPHKRVPLARRVGQLSGHAEIGQFDVALFAEKNVGSCNNQKGSQCNNRHGKAAAMAGLTLPLMSRWSLRSEWRYSSPLRTSRRMMAICISSKLPAFIKSRAEPPPRYSMMIHNFVPCLERK